MVSDCGAIDDIHARHKLVATPEEAAALGVTKGCDLECGSVYKTLGTALERGLLKQSDLDVALQRLMRARLKLGMFDPPERVRYAQIPYSVNDAPEHDRLARKVAQESIVLLKNDGILPLRKDVGTIAVVGPNADELVTLLGNYYGTPSRPVTILAGIRNAVSPRTRVLYARGVDLVEGRQDPRAAQAIDSAYLRPARGSSERGLTGRYFRGKQLQGEPVLTRVDPRVAFRWDRGAPTDEPVARGELDAARALDGDGFSVRWSGTLVPPVSGEYELTATANDGVRLFVDGQKLLEEWSETSVARAVSGRVRLEAGREHDVTLEYFEDVRDAEVRLGWRLPGAGTPFEEALAAARAADVVVFVGGLTAEVEGEEMRVSYPGFAGGDRTDIELPAIQKKMLEALHATGKPVVLVLTTGSAIGLGWAQENAARDRRGLVPGPAGRGCAGRRALRRLQPGGSAARHVLRVRRRSACLRRLRDGGTHATATSAGSRSTRSATASRTRASRTRDSACRARAPACATASRWRSTSRTPALGTATKWCSSTSAIRSPRRPPRSASCAASNA